MLHLRKHDSSSFFIPLYTRTLFNFRPMGRPAEAPLHIGVLPWLATGHLTPFLHLSTHLALLGHHVSFLSTPSNIRRLPSPHHPNLRPISLEPSVLLDVSTTADLSDSNDQSVRPLLRDAFDSLSSPLSAFIQGSSPPPDWLVCDYSAYWAPQIVRPLNVKSVFLSLFNASALSFIGPPDEMMHPTRRSPQDFTDAPKWVPFKTSVAFRLHQASKALSVFKPDGSGLSEVHRFGAMIRECDAVAVRSCIELEREELKLLKTLYEKPVIPIGHFPPADTAAACGEDSNEWKEAFEWLDKQARGSVVYAAFGSEVRLNNEEIHKIARGLELSELPYIWALRRPNGLDRSPSPVPPLEFTSRGLICHGWVPQLRILGHPAVGGFLTHCGWNSLVEGLKYGLSLVLMPMIFDQDLNARRLEEIGAGKEVPRDEEDGSFDADGIAKTLKLVMVEEEGEGYRAKARELKCVAGDKEIQDCYVKQFVAYMKDHRPVRELCDDGLHH